MYVGGDIIVDFFNRKSKIERIKSGDKDLFVEIIDENLSAMYRVAKGILKSEDDIEDSIQNTILIAFEKLHTLKKHEYFKTWLIRILINECNKIFNSNKRISSYDEVEEEVVHDDYKNLDLSKAIETLSSEFKITTVLYYYEDMSIKDIGKVLGVAEGTVKSRLSRAREQLYEIMKEGQ